jgi:hypothetical protein
MQFAKLGVLFVALIYPGIAKAGPVEDATVAFDSGD